MALAGVVGIATGCTLLVLSVMHVYWAAGGTAGKANSIPQRDGEPLFRPSMSTTLAVAALLAIGSFVVFTGLRWGNFLLAGVFGLRAVGDFRWVGFFKRERSSGFAKWDTWLYSPLCALISAGCITEAVDV